MIPNAFFILLLVICAIAGGLSVILFLYETRSFTYKKCMRTRISIKLFYKDVKD